MPQLVGGVSSSPFAVPLLHKIELIINSLGKSYKMDADHHLYQCTTTTTYIQSAISRLKVGAFVGRQKNQCLMCGQHRVTWLYKRNRATASRRRDSSFKKARQGTCPLVPVPGPAVPPAPKHVESADQTPIKNKNRARVRVKESMGDVPRAGKASFFEVAWSGKFKLRCGAVMKSDRSSSSTNGPKNANFPNKKLYIQNICDPSALFHFAAVTRVNIGYSCFISIK